MGPPATPYDKITLIQSRFYIYFVLFCTQIPQTLWQELSDIQEAMQLKARLVDLLTR